MKIFKTAVKAILVFDAAYLCFVCAEDVCSRIRSRMKKKNKTEPEPYFFDDEEEDTDYYLTPALCMDSLRLLHRGDVMDFIEERIVPKEKAVFQALTETEREMTKLLLASCIGLLWKKPLMMSGAFRRFWMCWDTVRVRMSLTQWTFSCRRTAKSRTRSRSISAATRNTSWPVRTRPGSLMCAA